MDLLLEPFYYDAVNYSSCYSPWSKLWTQDMEQLIEKATAAAPVQTFRIEQAPLSITTAPANKEDKPYTL